MPLAVASPQEETRAGKEKHMKLVISYYAKGCNIRYATIEQSKERTLYGKTCYYLYHGSPAFVVYSSLDEALNAVMRELLTFLVDEMISSICVDKE